MMDYIVDDMLEIKPLGSPFAAPWIGCLFIGSREECIRWVQERSGGETDGRQKSVDSTSGRSGHGGEVLQRPVGCKAVGGGTLLQLLDRGGERVSGRFWTCAMCGEKYDDEDLEELEEMGEAFTVLGDSAESDQMICPDCFDEWTRMDEDDKFEALMSMEDKA